MQHFTLNKAAKICHRSKSSILEAIRGGRLSAHMNDKNQWQIEASELHRVYPFIAKEPPTEQEIDIKNHEKDWQKNHLPNNAILDLLDKEKEERQRERTQLLENIEDLKNRLTASEQERRSVQEKLTLLLTYQPTSTTTTTKVLTSGGLWKKIFKR